MSDIHSLFRFAPRCFFEIRSNISDGRIARVVFGMVDDRMILLHGFIKKS